MIIYTLKRIGFMILTALTLLTVLFALLQFMPGSPFNDPKLSQSQITAIEDEYGLNEPVIIQYKNYMTKVLFEGDLGESFNKRGRDVTDIIVAPLTHTVKILVFTMLLGGFMGLLLGTLAAIYKDTVIDTICSVIGVLGVSIPAFAMATLVLITFSNLNIPTTYVYEGPIGKQIVTMIAPVITLSFFVTSSVLRFMRAELVEVMESDYILLARAKGLTQPEFIRKHAVRNALIPVISVLGPLVVSLLAGSLFAESFFGVPGLSRQLIDAINFLDYFVVLGISLFYALMYMVTMLIIDILYGVIDPRIRVSRRASR